MKNIRLALAVCAVASLARGADMLTTLPFRVSGPYDDPTVTPLLVDMGKP